MTIDKIIPNRKYVILNNSGSISPDGCYDYCFWFLRRLIRLVGDRPFSRGDLAEITSIDPDRQYINVKVWGDPLTEKMPEDLPPWDDIPGLIFVSTKLYLHEQSDYTLDTEDNIEILLSYTSVVDGNKAYAAAVTMTGSHGKITGRDDMTGVRWEWLIEERNPR